MKNIVKEFYTGKSDSGSGLSLTFILEDNKELRLQVSRDIAINLIETLYLSLDTKGIHRPKDLN
jgi:hypothetical protein